MISGRNSRSASRNCSPGAADRNSSESAETAAAAGLIYSSDAEAGYRRVGRGKRFRYVTPDNRPLTDPAELKRIARLAIPPGYTDVWICRSARGHLQATGRDARRRKQYRYHAQWRSVRDDSKFARMIEFGEALPKLRRRLRLDRALPGLPREKVLALIASLLDTTRLRIGNTEYARDNHSFGLTTLRNRHVKFIRDHRVLFRFRGKGGAEQEITVDDRRIVQIVRRCQQLPGQQLFQYIDDAGERHPVGSEQVNEYLREVMGGDFTAKDFRTCGASVRALVLMSHTPLPAVRSERALNACIVAAIKEVATELRNTPAVCRKSYIHPTVFSAWRNGTLPMASGERPYTSSARAESLALAFLRRPAKIAETVKSVGVAGRGRNKSSSATAAASPVRAGNSPDSSKSAVARTSASR